MIDWPDALVILTLASMLIGATREWFNNPEIGTAWAESVDIRLAVIENDIGHMQSRDREPAKEDTAP